MEHDAVEVFGLVAAVVAVVFVVGANGNRVRRLEVMAVRTIPTTMESLKRQQSLGAGMCNPQ